MPATETVDTSGVPGGRRTSPHGIRYRPDIDGLRAIAILPILLLHCGLKTLKGGFVGVDIFFVISGFLITGIITREIAEGGFSLAEFYRRRAVRILPALAVMVAVTLAAGCWLLLPISLRDLGYSAAATGLFSSNVYFYLTSGYFAQKAELQPLIHTWSLAVEEQFYLFYPIVLLFVRNMGRARIISILTLIAAVSFVVGGWFAMSDPSGGYFLLPARIWELMLGALVALGSYPRIAQGLVRSALCVLALAGILLCVALVGANWPFPVPFALPAVAGTALLLAYMPGTPVAWILETSVFRAIGRISYSLYLWHRPIIAFYMIGRPATLTLADSALLLGASFGAATLSYWLVERPALQRWGNGSRRTGTGIGTSISPNRVIICASAGIAFFAAAGLGVASKAWQIVSLPPQVARIASFQGFDSTPAGRAQFDLDRCFVIPTGRKYDPACLVPDTARPNVLLIGDSHAGQLAQALRQAMPSAHLIQATAAGCRPLLVGPGLRACRKIVDDAFHRLDFTQVHTVVLAGRWFSQDMQPLVDTIGFLRARGTSVIVVGPVVEYDADVPDTLSRAMLAHNLARMDSFRIRDRAPLDRRMKPIVTGAGASYLSWFAIECPQARCRLFSASKGPLHIDRTHVTPELASEMAARVAVRAGLDKPS